MSTTATDVAEQPAETINIDGKDYALHPFDATLAQKFEQWVRGNAWNEIQALKPDIPAGEYAQAMESIAKILAGTYFRIGGEGFQQAEKSIEGQYRKLWLMINALDPSVTWKQIQAWQMREFDRVMAERYEEARAKLAKK